MRNILVGIILIGLVSCSEIKPHKVSTYFSLDSIMNTQEVALTNLNAALTKTAYSSQDSVQKTYNPDSLQWANEFKLIRELEINKPALIGRYTIVNKKDDRSNLDILRYESKEDDLEIEFLELYYLKELQNLKKIKASSFESNSIFKSSKTIELELDHINDELLLTRYVVEGYQKMILQDSVQFKIEGKIKY